MSESRLRQKVSDALLAFAGGDLAKNAISLFNALGYRSEKRFPVSRYSPGSFLDDFNGSGQLKPEKALCDDWLTICPLFQVTADEIRSGSQFTLDFGKSKEVDRGRIESYLFFAVELSESYYTRGQLATVTREINKIFPMPVMVLFRHGNTLTFSVIDRRLSKRDESRDVLEKVTLIKDIRLANPHRAHVDILADLALEELYQQYGFTDFSGLHMAWRKVLDISVLNKQFFSELANWYFWASQYVTFPQDAGEDEAIRNATCLIRLITRLIFIWFIKEKNLVPDSLFNKAKLDAVLKYDDPAESTYYKAILQNLFFATLNQEMNTPEKPNNRRFRTRNPQPGGRDPDYNVTNIYRYENYFRNPSTAIRLFETIPFLNGGLFECLDKPDKDNPKKILRIDGFSDRAENELRVPDYLFFSDEVEVDLNEAYGTNNRTYKARGLINLLERYKFTVDENTPIEEEVALDPELLGKVFENLLASYNPETRTTARKATGSYYTPRDIVNYMVDESLMAYLTARLQATVPSLKATDNLTDILREVFAYKEDVHPFTDEEVTALIRAIDDVKVLDPACGSGAFPMGILHKLVFILSKLDPHNQRWKDKQLAKAAEITDPVTRERTIADTEDSFLRNEMNYVRKLYLIQDCIYGVDIQPIAVQIAKMRFFISLVVEQKLDDAQPNRGILPLPNLETKFVAANTLIEPEKPRINDNYVLRSPAVIKKEKELADVRRRHFTARTFRMKQKCREEDASLRAELGKLLVEEGFPGDTAGKYAQWDPYDQNTHAEWFEPKWMFGVSGGFDVVIANPPYGFRAVLSKDEKTFFRKEREIQFPSGDAAELFVIICLRQLVRRDGSLTFIVPKKSLYGESWRNMRRLWLDNRLTFLMDASQAFENVLLEQVAFSVIKGGKPGQIEVSALNGREDSISTYGSYGSSAIFTKDLKNVQMYRGLYAQSLLTKIADNSVSDSADYVKAEIGISNITPYLTSEPKHNYPCVKGIDIVNYGLKPDKRYLKGTVAEPYLQLYRHPKLVAQEIIAHVWNPRPHIIITMFFDSGNRLLNDTCVEIKVKSSSLEQKFLLGYYQSSFCNWYAYNLIFNRAIRTMHFIDYYVSQIAIPRSVIETPARQGALIGLVDQIIAITQDVDYTSNPTKQARVKNLERQIDKLVYQLYGLTEEEIGVVEGKNR